MKVCDSCGVSDDNKYTAYDSRGQIEKWQKVYEYDLCEKCNMKVIEFVIKLVGRR